MNYIIFDLEYNQQHPDDIKASEPKPSLLFEIIQIGAIKINKNLNLVSTFNSLIRPNLHLKLHPYVEDITKIKIEDLINSDDFKNVFNDFIRFIGKDDYTFVVWGGSDIKELIKNIEFHNLDSSRISNKYIDIQSYTSKLLKLPKGQRVSLKNAVEAFNIPVEGDFHDAFFDAHYTCEIFKSVHNKNLTPTTFVKNSEKRPKVKKEKLDSEALINEFEKIYNRKMSKEEIKMIRLAYFMGKTKQFLLKDE